MSWGIWCAFGFVVPFILGFCVPLRRALKDIRTKQTVVESWRLFARVGVGALIAVNVCGHVGLAHSAFSQSAFFAASLLPIAGACFLVGRGLGAYLVLIE